MRYPILDLDFAIPVTIGSGRIIIDPDGVLRLDLYDPEDQIVVMEKMAPIERDVVEREHHPHCCTLNDGEGSWSEATECDAECWCHTPVPESTAPPTNEEVLERIRERIWPVPGLDEEKPPYDPRAAGTVYPGRTEPRVQPYTRKKVSTDPWGKAEATVCEACGCMVWDLNQHDLWHSKTRSQM